MLSRAARHLSTKARTRLVGLDAVPDALPVLNELCKQQLEAVQVLPAGIPYRQDVEKFSNFLMATAKASKSVDEFEAKVGLGEVEEVIDMVRSEMALIPKYAEWRAWETPMGEEKARLDTNKAIVLESLKDRGAAVRRLDIPMREPSVDFPTAVHVETTPYSPPEEPEKKECGTSGLPLAKPCHPRRTSFRTRRLSPWRAVALARDPRLNRHRDELGATRVVPKALAQVGPTSPDARWWAVTRCPCSASVAAAKAQQLGAEAAAGPGGTAALWAMRLARTRTPPASSRRQTDHGSADCDFQNEILRNDPLLESGPVSRTRVGEPLGYPIGEALQNALLWELFLMMMPAWKSAGLICGCPVSYAVGSTD
eukprot:CAMPEP_0185550548 /NCGR_PEP_ID=MMETSP1381-20130426/21852_1 /TAXON_ID=298111 /ORGANISM="Pavlova sp., Strain CCMP459" /LENGTH=367 /DNA_ID=CAMNT_0028163343 /DNA_START=19 /DNA_END=1124 /DNA_ORIENTATION=-